jgi:DNA-binding response OmpR family regulator
VPPGAALRAGTPGSFVLAPTVPRQVQAALPLQGVTLLAVEDSRFASDALRLLCQRSGARLRRAETLDQAQAHLRVYRPDVLLVDLGLPDGRGEGLIRQMVLAGAGRPAVLGMSGDPDGRGKALAAGADGFLDKPFASLGDFQRAVLALLPDRAGEEASGQGEVRADRAALHDDLAQVAQAVEAGPGLEERRYLAGFLTGLALQTQDRALEREADALRHGGAGLQGLTQLLQDRMEGSAPFRPGAV